MDLENSLSRTGIIHPPIVIQETVEDFTIVSGFRRLTFAHTSTKLDRIDCMVLEKGASFSHILDIILTDQNSDAKLSLAEKARFVQIASRFSTDNDIVGNYLSRLELKKRPSVTLMLLDLLKQEESIIREVHSGRLQEKMVAEILKLPEVADRLALVQLFKTLGMGDGKQRRFFNLIRDIAYRKGSSIVSYLGNKNIRGILNNSEMNVPQKIFHLGDLLQQQLTPSASKAEEDFRKKVKNLQLPANYSISHSPSFEKDAITLSIIFEDFSTCKQYLDQKQK